MKCGADARVPSRAPCVYSTFCWRSSRTRPEHNGQHNRARSDKPQDCFAASAVMGTSRQCIVRHAALRSVAAIAASKGCRLTSS